MYIVRHPNLTRPRRYAKWSDELGWIWTYLPDRATAFGDVHVACMAAMEIEERHGVDLQGQVMHRDGAILDWEQARKAALAKPAAPAAAIPEARMQWTPEQLAREAEYADRRLGGGA